MKGDQKIIKYLNQALSNELTAINQYFLHARMYKNWGLKKLDEHVRQESLDEMKHADALIQRILFLEGLPNLQNLGKLLIGENPHEMLKCDLTLERSARNLLKEAIAGCESLGDYASRELLDDLQVETEEHINWLETQLDLIARIGLENYLQAQM